MSWLDVNTSESRECWVYPRRVVVGFDIDNRSSR